MSYVVLRALLWIEDAMAYHDTKDYELIALIS